MHSTVATISADVEYMFESEVIDYAAADARFLHPLARAPLKWSVEPTAQELHAAIAADRESDFDDMRARTSVRVKRWHVCHNSGEYVADTFLALLDLLARLHIQYAYVADSVRTFALIDWAIHDDAAHPWRRVEREEQTDPETGRYMKVQGYGYAELTGEYGQRYLLRIWAPHKSTRAQGGDRHERTHGTDLYGFQNIMTRGLAAAARDFGLTKEGRRTEAATLYDALERFDALMKKYAGRPFLGEKKPAGMTAGSIAKNELLRELYGCERASNNAKKFRRDHPIDRETTDLMRGMHLMRGGIMYVNEEMTRGKDFDAAESEIRAKKWDINSSYLSIAENMPDLRNFGDVDIFEAFHRRAGYTYIIIFSHFEMFLKHGRVPIFTHPKTGKNPKNVIIDGAFAIYADELDELAEWYEIGDVDVMRVMRCVNTYVGGYRRYARKWYGLKAEARARGEEAVASFAKIFINSALGKLAQRSAFPICTTVWDDNLEDFKLQKDPPTPEELTDSGLLSIYQGAYVTAMARVKIMREIRLTCGAEMCYNLLMSDTDSIVTTADVMPDHVGAGLGQFKLENAFSWLRIIDRKVYAGREDDGTACVHCRGIPAAAIISEICDAWGADDVREVPAEGYAAAFREYIPYRTPICARVHGGRAVLYTTRTITTAGITQGGRGASSTLGAVAAGYNGEFYEV